MNSRMGWSGYGGVVCEVSKTSAYSILEAAMMQVGTHTMPYAILVGHSGSGSNLMSP